jgi:hypothetical protein
MDVLEIEREVLDWVDMAKGRVKLAAVSNKAMKLRLV